MTAKELIAQRVSRIYYRKYSENFVNRLVDDFKSSNMGYREFEKVVGIDQKLISLMVRGIYFKRFRKKSDKCIAEKYPKILKISEKYNGGVEYVSKGGIIPCHQCPPLFKG